MYVNPNTKKAKGMIWNYEHSTDHSLSEAYKSCSPAKQRAENSILSAMRFDGGHSYRVCGSNCFSFTCAYQTVIDGVNYLIYHTPSYCYEIPYNN